MSEFNVKDRIDELLTKFTPEEKKLFGPLLDNPLLKNMLYNNKMLASRLEATEEAKKQILRKEKRYESQKSI